MTSRGVVYVDAGERYDLVLPANWVIHHARSWGGIAAGMRWCLKRYPKATRYGWLADDTFPRTFGWDKLLERAAGSWYYAQARDMWFSENPPHRYDRQDWPEYLRTGAQLSAGLCWGAALIRAVGWWALPGCAQGGIDAAWSQIIAPLGLCRYLPDVVVEHKTWHLNKRPKDLTDNGKHIDQDVWRYRAWENSPSYHRVMRRLEAAL